MSYFEVIATILKRNVLSNWGHIPSVKIHDDERLPCCARCCVLTRDFAAGEKKKINPHCRITDKTFSKRE